MRLIAPITLFACATLSATAQAQLRTGDQLVVTAQWLHQHQHDADLRILHVGPPTGFAVAHIAGSHFVATRDLSTPNVPGALSLEMPAESQLRSVLEGYGISDNSRIVVVFDSEWVSPATRVLFTLGYAGLGDRAMYLDGGVAAWKAAGYPLARDTVATPPGHITRHVIPSLIVDNQYVAAHASSAHARLIDARAAVHFTDSANTQYHMSAGHIPGATNLPFNTVVDDNDRLLDKAALAAKFRAAGVAPGDTVVAYCHVGQQATVVLLAARILGHPVRLYDGSFQDWSMRKFPTTGGK